MTIFTNPIMAVEEAEFLSSRLGQTLHLIDVGNMNIEVRNHYAADETVLEIVRPPLYEPDR